MYNLNERFTDEEADLLKTHKELVRTRLKKPKLSWHDYLLHQANSKEETE